MDDDTSADLLVANENTGEVSVLEGNGDGTFATADNYPAGFSSQSVAAGGTEAMHEAIDALSALGYKPAEVKRLLAQLETGGKSAEEIIRLALKRAVT